MDMGEENASPNSSSSENNFDAPETETQSERTRHLFGGSRRYHGASEMQQYEAAAKLANDPNTPEFFSQAMMARIESPKPRKSHKKGIIIIIISILVTIAVIAVVTILLLSQKSITSLFSGGLLENYNRYANYILYGKDSKDNITAAFSGKENYHFLSIDLVSADPNEINKITKLSNNYYQSFQDIHVENETEEYSMLKHYTERQKKEIEFMLKINTKKTPTSRDIFLDYNTIGNSATEKKYLNYYGDYDGDNSAIIEYIAAYKEWYGKVISLVKAYNKYGCLAESKKDGSIGCMDFKMEKDDFHDFAEIYNSVNQQYANLKNRGDIADDYIYNLLIINKYIASYEK